MNAFTLHYRCDFMTDCADLLRKISQIAVSTIFQRSQGINHTVDSQLTPKSRVNIVVPGDIRQDVLQNVGEAAVIFAIAFGWSNMSCSLRDVNDDVAIAAGGMSGGRQQQWVFNAF